MQRQEQLISHFMKNVFYDRTRPCSLLRVLRVLRGKDSISRIVGTVFDHIDLRNYLP